jgi:hypothetical protein
MQQTRSTPVPGYWATCRSSPFSSEGQFPPSASSGGCQRSSDACRPGPVENRKIEQTAIAFAKRRLSSGKWRFISKESDKVGFDLLATRRGVERHIEVKGVKGTKPDFIITAAEVRSAQTDRRWEAWVVTSALSTSPRCTEIPGADLVQLYDLKTIACRAIRISP